MLNWYRLAQKFLEESNYWIDEKGHIYGGLIHQDIILGLLDSHNLWENYGIDEQMILGGSLTKLYNKLRENGWIRVVISKNTVYIDLENISNNIGKLEDLFFKLNPKQITRAIIEDKKYAKVLELDLVNFFESGENLQDYLGRHTLYKIAQHAACMWIDPNGTLFSGSSHAAIIEKFFKELPRDHTIQQAHSIDDANHIMFDLGWIRIHISSGNLVVQMREATSQNLRNLENFIFTIAPQVYQVFLGTDIMTKQFLIKDFLYSGTTLQEFLGRLK